MTDAELIARMLDGGVLAGRMIADRFEALRAALTAALARADAAEAALAAADPLADPRVQALVEALKAVAQHEVSVFWGPDAEKNERASWRGVMRKVKAALAYVDGEKT
jgi:hypothetical protein